MHGTVCNMTSGVVLHSRWQVW